MYIKTFTVEPNLLVIEKEKKIYNNCCVQWVLPVNFLVQNCLLRIQDGAKKLLYDLFI